MPWVEVPSSSSSGAARLAERQGLTVESFLPRWLTLRVDLSDTVDLRTPDTRHALQISEDDLVSDDVSTTRRIGHAAHVQGFEAIMAPSATGVGDVLVVFAERLRVPSTLEILARTTRSNPA